MTPEMRTMEEQYVAGLNVLTCSFKVFDYTRVQRRSYYHPPNAQTASTATAVSTATHLSPGPKLSLSRPGTPSERAAELQSQGGLDVEAQIADGGGLANVGGRGANAGVEADSVEMSRFVNCRIIG